MKPTGDLHHGHPHQPICRVYGSLRSLLRRRDQHHLQARIGLAPPRAPEVNRSSNQQAGPAWMLETPSRLHLLRRLTVGSTLAVDAPRPIGHRGPSLADEEPALPASYLPNARTGQRLQWRIPHSRRAQEDNGAGTTNTSRCQRPALPRRVGSRPGGKPAFDNCDARTIFRSQQSPSLNRHQRRASRPVTGAGSPGGRVTYRTARGPDLPSTPQRWPARLVGACRTRSRQVARHERGRQRQLQADLEAATETPIGAVHKGRPAEAHQEHRETPAWDPGERQVGCG
jgi:hypothetical protein